jgi:ubiquinone/menaquinone biosynthesis C-methylase UbiE
MPDLAERVHTPELMDDPAQPPEAFARAYRELRTINRYLGGVRAVRRFLPDLEEGSILDVAAGACDIGDRVALNGRWRVVALDRQREGLLHAEHCLPVVGDAFELPFAPDTFDYVTSSLFFHHLQDDACARLLEGLVRVARRRVVVNELHRAAVAYWSIQWLTRLFSGSAMIRNDAPLSVLRGFRAQELVDIAARAGFRGRVYRSFPYRLVLVLDKGWAR